MPKTVNEEKARQGRWGFNVLTILVVALILAMIVWWGAEMFGQSTETPRTGGEVESVTPETSPASPATPSQ